MKKKILVILVLVLVLLLFTSCTELQVMKKDLASSTKGLERVITVKDFEGNEIWRYEGRSYIDDRSSFGDVTIVYYEGKTPRKIDFIGFYSVMAKEL